MDRHNKIKPLKNKAVINMNIDKKEVLRYLGYKDKIHVDDRMDSLIDELILETYSTSRKNYSYRFYDLDESTRLVDTDVELTGENIKEHLVGCEKCCIVGVTLGSEIDKRLRYYTKVDLTKALIFNACATAGIESLCNSVNSLIKMIAINNKWGITNRYSPGYGDFPLSIQHGILSLIDGESIGLTCNEESILIPRKSITAIIGLGRDSIEKLRGCKDCNLSHDCLFIKDGETCGI